MEFESVWEALAEGRHDLVFRTKRFREEPRYWAAGLVSLQATGWRRGVREVMPEVRKLPHAELIEAFGEVAKLRNPYVSMIASIVLSECIGCAEVEARVILRDYDPQIEWSAYLFRAVVYGETEVKDESYWLGNESALEEGLGVWYVKQYQDFFEEVTALSKEFQLGPASKHDQVFLALCRNSNIEGKIDAKSCRKALRRFPYSRELYELVRETDRIRLRDVVYRPRVTFDLVFAADAMIRGAQREGERR